MAASLMSRLSRAKPSPRLLASLNAGLAPKSAARIAIPELGSPETQILGGNRPEPSPPRRPQIVFPSFPFGCVLDPRLSPPPGVAESEEVESESDDARTVWADSTKQKKKKKMNKHKYQKRRKLLRRKSRA